MVSSESMHTIRNGSVPRPPLDVSCHVRTGDIFITIFLYSSFCTRHFSLSPSSLILSSLQDVKSGECFRLDHLIKQHFEKEMANKKMAQEEKDALSLTLARLDGMNMVCMYVWCE